MPIVLTLGIYSKRKLIAPLVSKFFPFRVDPFSGGLAVKQTGSHKSHKQEAIKIVSRDDNGGKLSSPLTVSEYLG